MKTKNGRRSSSPVPPPYWPSFYKGKGVWVRCFTNSNSLFSGSRRVENVKRQRMMNFYAREPFRRISELNPTPSSFHAINPFVSDIHELFSLCERAETFTDQITISMFRKSCGTICQTLNKMRKSPTLVISKPHELLRIVLIRWWIAPL